MFVIVLRLINSQKYELLLAVLAVHNMFGFSVGIDILY